MSSEIRSRLRFGSTSLPLTVCNWKGTLCASAECERSSRKASSITLLTLVPRCSAYCFAFSSRGSDIATVVRISHSSIGMPLASQHDAIRINFNISEKHQSTTTRPEARICENDNRDASLCSALLPHRPVKPRSLTSCTSIQKHQSLGCVQIRVSSERPLPNLHTMNHHIQIRPAYGFLRRRSNPRPG